MRDRNPNSASNACTYGLLRMRLYTSRIVRFEKKLILTRLKCITLNVLNVKTFHIIKGNPSPNDLIVT